MSRSKILFMMTGSIACYKACHVISRLAQAQCEVQVVASPSALKFVGNATLEGLTGRPAVSDMYAAGNVMDHIHLMRWADLIIAAPATASFINKASQGVGDDLLQTMFLAHDFSKPFLIAPAMNKSMFTHPITQKSLQNLKDMGLQILDSASGILACGEEGWGRLLEPDLILKEIFEALNKKNQTSASNPVQASSLKTKILVTAGGTKEPIDTVRSITNTSTGKTGITIAETLAHLGFEVTLLQAQGTSQSYEVQHQHYFSSFKDLHDLTRSLLTQQEFDFVIHAAAVSDYSVAGVKINGQSFSPQELKKISSAADTMELVLKRNPKIVNELKSLSKNKNLKVIAFKLTSSAASQERAQAVKKLFDQGHVDYVVHNDLTEINPETKTHLFTLFDENTQVPCESLDQLLVELTRIVTQKA